MIESIIIQILKCHKVTQNSKPKVSSEIKINCLIIIIYETKDSLLSSLNYWICIE